MDKFRQFDIATAICEAHIYFHSLTDSPGPENDGNDNGLSKNPEESDDPVSTISTTEACLTHIPCYWN